MNAFYNAVIFGALKVGSIKNNTITLLRVIPKISGISSDMLSDILSSISSDILSGHILSGTSSAYLRTLFLAFYLAYLLTRG